MRNTILIIWRYYSNYFKQLKLKYKDKQAKNGKETILIPAKSRVFHTQMQSRKLTAIEDGLNWKNKKT